MAYDVKIICDSITSAGVRLTTMEVTLPRIVLAEFNTHRMFSRNSASSRAIPVEKMLRRVIDDPFIPVYWGKNQKGMQADEELTEEQQALAEHKWLKARDKAIASVRGLLRLGIHKQITNRLLEPWLWHTIIVSSTEWENFFALRTHKDAQPEIRKAAMMMNAAYVASSPTLVFDDEWHLPLVSDHEQLVSDGFSQDDICLISIGRCARVSYLTHNGVRDPKADIELAMKLKSSGHMSPFEHVAKPMSDDDAFNISGNYCPEDTFNGNFRGWTQYRKLILNEDNFMLNLKERK